MSVALICTSAATADADDLNFATNIVPRTIVADQLIQLATTGLQNVYGVVAPTRPDQFTRARILLELALQLVPDDAEAWRLRFDLAKRTNDTETKINALMEICRIQPEDDAAQLELVMMLIDRRQTLEERVETAEQFLIGSKSERFSKPLRSRLASYVAQGAAEIGEEDRFKRYLVTALKLDPTNIQAARMAYDVVVARKQSSVVAIGSALMNLIGAEPFNVELRIRLGHLLLGEGLYEQSAKQFTVVNRINPQTTTFDVLFDWCLGLAATGELDRAIELVNGADEGLAIQYQQERLIQLYRQQQQKEARDRKDDGPGDDQSPPAPGKRRPLPLDLELLRLTILHRAGYKAKADGAYGRLAEQLKVRIDAGDTLARGDLVWHSVLFDRHGPEEQALHAQLARQANRNKALLARIQGWTALNNGQQEKAREILEPWAEQDPMAAYGVALSCAEGDTALRTEFLQKAANGAYDHIAGLLSALELSQLDLEPDPTESGKLIAKAYDRWPGTWRNPDPNASPLVQFSMTPRSNELEYLDPLTVTIRLRNASEVPLSLGEEGTVPTNVFLIAALHPLAGEKLRDLPATVVDMRRRLTIGPDETLTVRTSLDRSRLGGMLNRSAMERVGFSLAAFLDPKPVPNEQLAVGLLGSIDREVHLQRIAYPDSDVENWFAQLNGPDPVDRISAAARLNQVLPRMFGIVEKLSQTLESEDEDEEEDLDAVKRRGEQMKTAQVMAFRVSNELSSAFGKFEPYEQAWMCAFLPNDKKSADALRPVHNSAQKSNDPIVRIAYLATQVHNPNSPLIDSDLRHTHPMVRDFAESHRTWLAKTREALVDLQKKQLEYQRQQQQQQR